MADQLQLSQLSSRSNRNHDQSKSIALLQHSHFQRILNQQTSEIVNYQQSKFYLTFLQKLGKLCTPCSICCCHCCLQYPLYQQNTGQLGLLTKFGKYSATINPGLKILNPITQKIISVNMKTNTFVIQQQVITKDNVQFKIQSVIFYRVFQPMHLAYRLGSDIKFAEICVSQIAKSTLRSVSGAVDLQYLIQNREQIASQLQIQVNKQTNFWGITIDKCCIKQLFLTKQMIEVFSVVTSTRRRSEALIINAKANVQSAKLLKQAADILDDKAAMQIRYLQAIEQILSRPSNNIIFLNTHPN